MSKNSAVDLVVRFMGRQNTIAVPVPFVHLTGDYASAAFLSQCLYWGDRTADAEGWFHKSHEEWADELLLTSDQVRRCVKTCGGMIEVKRKGVPAKNHYRANREAIAEALQNLANGKRDSTARCGETQHLEVDKPNDLPLGSPDSLSLGNPTAISETTSKTTQKEETETEGEEVEQAALPQVPVSAEGQDQDTRTGAADTARANTPTPPLQEPDLPKANGRAPSATSPKDGPGAARPVENPVDNFPEGPSRKFLTGCFGAEWLGRLLEEDPSRRDWFQLASETFQTQKDDALATSAKGKWKSALIGLLDAETASLRRARRPSSSGVKPAQSVNELINARIAATRRAE